MAPLGCMQCGTVTALRQQGWRWRCAACTPTPPEPLCTGPHTWQAVDGRGLWGCRVCGIVLSSRDASTDGAATFGGAD